MNFLLSKMSTTLLRHALHVCPPARSKWIAAAAKELGYVDNSYETLVWSVGVVEASYRERIRSMTLHEPQIAKPILLLEMLICFLPVTVFCGTVSRAATNSLVSASEALLLATATLVGPFGLALFGGILIGVPRSRGKYRARVLTLLLAWTAIVVLFSPVGSMPLNNLPWRDCVLLLLLPTIGVAHYALLARDIDADMSCSP
jgi:hypothetical protein